MDDEDKKPPDHAAGMAEGLKDVSDEAGLPSDGIISGIDAINEPMSTNTQQQPLTQTGPDRAYPQGHPYPGLPEQRPSQGQGYTGQQVPPYPYPGQHWQVPGQGQPDNPFPYPRQGENRYSHIPPYDPRFGHYDYRYGGYVHPQTGGFLRWPDPYGQQQYPQSDGSQPQSVSQQGVETRRQTGPQPPPGYSLYPSESPPPYNGQQGSRLKLEQVNTPSCKIEVSGLPTTITNDSISLYFENRRRSGGGPVVNVINREDGTALVEFERVEDVKRVLEKASHKVQSKDVKVALYKPRPPTPPPVVSVDTITVTGCGDITDDVLEMYFESKMKSGGGDVKSLERREEDGSEVVLVTFEDPEDMEAVLQRQSSHQLRGRSLQVSPYILPSRSTSRHTLAEGLYLSSVNTPSCKIEVSGLTTTITIDSISLYFENRRRSGGGPVVNVINREDGTALVEFERVEDVKRVLEKASHKVQSKDVKVALYKPRPPTPPPVVSVDTITVTGCGDITDDVLEMYFESKMKSGGGDVKSLERREEDGSEVVLVTFEDPEDMEAVLQRQSSHQLRGRSLQVSPYILPSRSTSRHTLAEGLYLSSVNTPSCKIEVSGLPTTITIDSISLYFENRRRSGGGPVVNVINREDGTALVEFERVEDVKRVLEKASHKVQSKDVKVVLYKPRPPTPPPVVSVDTITVTGCGDITDDVLEMYFESKMKSGGGDVKSLERREEGGSEVVLVTFEDPEDMEAVVQRPSSHQLRGRSLQVSPYILPSRSTSHHTQAEGLCLSSVIPEVLGRSHNLEKATLSVSLYTECLGSGGGHSNPTLFSIPPPITVQNADCYKLKFIRGSSPNMKNLQKQLDDGYTSLKFESDGSVTLECCLTKDVTDARKIAKEWRKDATDDFEHFLSLLISEKINVLQEVWNDVITEVQKMKLPKQDAATIFSFDESHLIVVVGHKLLAENLCKRVKEIVATVEWDHQRKKKEITEPVSSLKSWQLRLLQALGFPGEIMKRYEHLKVDICAKSNVMKLNGLVPVVKSAKADMYETITAFKDTSLSNLSDAQMMLVQKTDVRKFIVEKLKQKHLVGVWEVDNGKLKVYGRTDAEVTNVSHILRQSVVQQLINLDPESVPLLNSPAWKRICENQNRGDMVKIIIAVDQSHIVIAAIDDLVAGVTDAVNNFLKENTVYSYTVQFPKGIQRFMTLHLDGEIRQLSKTFQAHSVQIEFQKSSQDFTMKGTKDGLRICMSKLKEISGKVMHTSHRFGKPGMCKLIRSEKGDQHIRYIEQNGRCVIDRNFDSQEQPIYGKKGVQRSMRSGMQTLATCDLGAGRTLSVCQGDITQMKVDVIVNSANQKLAHIGGLAKAIVDKGGLSIQVESDKIRQSQGDIGVGEVALTSSGNLPCKRVIHAVLPIWSGGGNDEQGLLQEAIFNSLEKADSCGFSSIAIPALSTGILRYPVAAATKNIIEAIQLHFKDTPGSQVMKVYVCDNNASTIQEFMQAVKQRFGADAITVGNQDESVEDVVEDRHIPQSRGRPRRKPNYVFGEFTDQTERATRPTEQPMNDITLYFFSDRMKHIDEAKSMLENVYQDSTVTKPILDPAFKTLSKHQEAKIRDLGSKFSISVDYDRSIGRVKLQGLTNDVITAMDAVHKIVQEALRQENLSEKAEMLSSYVQWSYIEVDSTGASQTTKYDKIINQQLEEAYQNKKSLIHLPPDTDGNVYVVDLNNMEQYDTAFPSDKVSVIRKDLIKGASFEPPPNWTQMTAESEMVPLSSATQEFSAVRRKFGHSLGRHANILKIERIQTKFLWQQYVAKKQQLDSQNPGHQNETVLWHGTVVNAIPSICKGGFNRSYCGKNATALGEGVYFAVQASYSDRNTYSVPDIQGHKHIFQARVLTGMYCRGKGGMRVPPQRDASNHIQFDSVVDNVNRPGMYIIFNDIQAYPEYLITYQ